MKCPDCQGPMEEVLLTEGILVEQCEHCTALFLDEGELENLVVKRSDLKEYNKNGLMNGKSVQTACPSCQNPTMSEGRLPGLDLQIKDCPSCRGIYLDKNSIKNFNWSPAFRNIKVDKTIDDQFTHVTRDPQEVTVFKIPSLGFTSVAVIGSLYALLFGLMIFLVEMGTVNETGGILIMVGFVILQFIFAPIIMDWSLSLIGSLDWVVTKQLPPHLEKFFIQISSDLKVPIPKIGIIRDGSPQAYTYGRTPHSARVVLSQRLWLFLALPILA